MKIHIFTKQKGQDFIQDLHSSLDKAGFCESLSEKLATNGLDFDSAIVIYDTGDIRQFTDIGSLINELGRTGL